MIPVEIRTTHTQNSLGFSHSQITGNVTRISLFLLVSMILLGYAARTVDAQVTPFTTETGMISLSSDAIGTNAASGVVQVQKPAGATVRKAYLFAASVPGGPTLTNTDITIDGAAVTFNASYVNVLFGFNTNNYRGDVTSLVKTKIDSAPPGLVDFTVVENPTKNSGIDGTILAVIFDDPNQTVTNTIALLFGGQRPTGDNFAVLLANPINTSAPGFALDMSLGISFSAQGSTQFSRVDVSTNTRPAARLTTSAGGQDDGPAAGGNGSLITVGGLGDTNANPPDPNAASYQRTIGRRALQPHTLCKQRRHEYKRRHVKPIER